MDLAELVISSQDYPAHFSYAEYPRYFEAFTVRAEPVFSSLAETGAEDSIAAFLKTVEGHIAQLPRRERKNAAYQIKQVLALFFGPAALRHGADSAAFAEQLCTRWNQTYPRNPFLLGEFETLMKGFDANLLGLPLRKSK